MRTCEEAQIHSPQMRRAAISTVLAALALLLIAGCGGDGGGKIPAEQGERMQELTDELAEQIGDDRCSDASRTLTEIRQVANEVEELDQVEGGVKRTLQELITRIDVQIDEQCEEPEPEPEETTTEPTTVPPETFEEPTTTTTTEETTTTTTTTDRTSPGQGGTPPGQGGTPPGQGGGGSGGTGSGGTGSGGGFVPEDGG
jgi:hypothetical protein